MNVTTVDWQSANQAYLTASLNIVLEELVFYKKHLNDREKLTFSPSAAARQQLEAAKAQLPQQAALEKFVQDFKLSAFERKILLLCIGVELNRHFASIITEIRGNTQLYYPTFDIALAAFPKDAYWSAITPVAPLRYWDIITLLEPNNKFTNSAIKITEQLLHYITGVYYLNEKLHAVLKPIAVPKLIVDAHKVILNKILKTYNKTLDKQLPFIQLISNNPSNQANTAAYISTEIGLQALTLNYFPNSLTELYELTNLWNREALLRPYALFLNAKIIDLTNKEQQQLLHYFIEKIQAVLFIGNDNKLALNLRESIVFELKNPSQKEQINLWEKALGNHAAQLNGQLKILTSHFNLNAETIASASQNAIAQQNSKSSNDRNLEKTLWKACCTYNRPKIDALAQRIEPIANWETLVLPPTEMEILQAIVVQVKHRHKVYKQWGFSSASNRGLGVSALFTGESGTGKTMAAEVLANALQLDLYKIDLSQVVNKYIGETEKNLKRIFDAAEGSSAILLFDEADALFGKRSEVKDSRDRYSNIEVSYLLQRMESYKGLAVLTSNMKSAIDKAFMRRIRFAVHFQRPDALHRAKIWKRIFPKDAPTKNLNIQQLAKLNIPGGNIKNIALNAAFIAASEQQAIQMQHLLKAARAEYTKLDKTLTLNEIKNWI